MKPGILTLTTFCPA